MSDSFKVKIEVSNLYFGDIVELHTTQNGHQWTMAAIPIEKIDEVIEALKNVQHETS